MVSVKTYGEMPLNEEEILRYAGCARDDSSAKNLLLECLPELAGAISYKVCYSVLPVSVSDEGCYVGTLFFKSRDLAHNLAGCDNAVIFGATLGVGIDRLINRYGAISPAKALMFDAVGTGQIEALCDRFCADIAAKQNAAVRPRFSPGYGDMSLQYQKDFFTLLGCQKYIGLTVTESLIMSPAKSVTAIMGFDLKAGKECLSKCETCNKTNCSFRRM